MIPLERVLKNRPESKGSFIDGRWRVERRASGSFEVNSPANVEWSLPSVPFYFDHIDEAMRSAHAAFRSWRQHGPGARAEYIEEFGRELEKRADDLARTMAVESGKTLDECVAEVGALRNKIRISIDEGLALVAPRETDLGNGSRGQVHHLPKGVFVVLGPFNFPVHLSHGHIIPALLSGNVCILKPSEKVPYSAQLYIEAAAAADFPAGVLQLLQGPGEVGMRLAKHASTNGVLATCSFEVGSKISRELADTPEKVLALEMGGKNAALVWDGADLDKVAGDLIRSSFLTTGQRCSALSRVYVKPDLLDALTGKVHALAKELVISHPFDDEPKPFMGPLISAAAKEKFLRYASIAEAEDGATTIMRSKPLEGTSRLSRKPLPAGHYVTPSLVRLEKWNPKSAYQSHELFGPDLFFCPVGSVEEGVTAINSSHYGLVASVFGGNEDFFNRVAKDIECGLIYWNRPTVGASSRLPFGGWKHSGNGHPAGLFAIYCSTQVQTRIL